MLETGGEGGCSLYGINMTTHHPSFLQLARDPRITGIVACLIGENICLQHSKTVHKSTDDEAQPGGGQVLFHQDFAYFPHTNYDVLAAMLVLDDFTEENACMRVVRGSHKLGLLDHNTTADGFFNAEPLQRELWEDDASLAKLMPRAGGLSIHHALALHGSPVNASGRPRRGQHHHCLRLICYRCAVDTKWSTLALTQSLSELVGAGLVFQYRAADAYQLADNLWEDGGLVVRGEASKTVRCEPGVLVLPKYAGGELSSRGRHGSLWNQESEWAVARNEEWLAARDNAGSKL